MVPDTVLISPWMRLVLGFLTVMEIIMPAGWPRSYNLMDGEEFDFIVVGAGSAGAVVATRLSEISHWRVLLVEAGGDPPPASVIPSLFATMAHTETDWDYRALFDEGTGQAHPDGVLFLTRGKMLGGSSSNNYEIYSRGVPQDYDDWNAVAPGWDWNTTLYYFKKLEGMTDPTVLYNPKTSYLHSDKGPVLISRPETNIIFTEITENYLESLQEIGIHRVLESNGPEIVGASRPHFTFANGKRSSTAEAYLKPAKGRKNLHVAKYARATKVLIDPYTSKAYGVEVLLRSGKTVNVYAKTEIIVSAGAVESPKLLMLSGIGPEDELTKHHIDVIADLPVGKNLQDHQTTSIIFTGLRGLSSAVQSLVTVKELNAYPIPIQNGFFQLNHSQNYRKPDFQIFNTHSGAASSPVILYLCKAITNYDDAFCYSWAESNVYSEIDATQLVLLHPASRGQVTLRSRNPLDRPIIHLGFYRNEVDVQTTVKGLKFLLNIVNTSYFRKVKGTVARLKVRGCEGFEWGSDEYWRCYVKNSAGSLLHTAGTCAMGPEGVVDERLRVHSISGLRVVDASIMPTIPSGNTNAPTMMIGERASDLIKTDYLY